ncbi:MAG: hypothetical protein SGJ11_08950 [Phycisphaerae bacterium]|nr:hypothetical protein [Phycisphaerae bacterium]
MLCRPFTTAVILPLVAAIAIGHGAAAQSATATPLATPPAQTPSPPAAPATMPDAPLPTAEELFAKQAAACGGDEAFAKIESMTSKATMKMPATNLNGTIVSHFAVAPAHGKDAGNVAGNGRFVVLMNLPGIGDVRTGFDGTVGWSTDKVLGPRLLEGKELEQIKTDSDFRRELSLHKKFDSATVAALTTWAEKPAYEVRLKGQSGDPQREMTVYLDQATSLLIGMKMLAQTPSGAVPIETTVSEYRAYEGPAGKIMLPAKTTLVWLGQKQILEVEEVDFDPIDPTVFELPEAIKALVKARDSAPPKPEAPANPAKAPADTPSPTKTNIP